MLEMLKARKEALQAEGKKGFTLMEMLIVIAIIAVLIAIAIPVFASQTENAAQATDAASLRSAYAMASAKAITDNVDTAAGPVTITHNDSSWNDKLSSETIGGIQLGGTGNEIATTSKGNEFYVVVKAAGGESNTVTITKTKPAASAAQIVDPTTGTVTQAHTTS
ncbi:MAG: prepilin-type N-terminal cleavage/methylation domain-containing protein [Eggerthellaceae bacterium]|nr:prepilin-type N-terminal cleavage/methylation domain-containing protein [Eggerthellaceae bacterium]